MSGNKKIIDPHLQIQILKQNYPIIIGITGQIAAGKTFILNYLKSKKFKCFNSDEVVAKLYERKFVLLGLSGSFDKKTIGKTIYENRLEGLSYKNFCILSSELGSADL